MSEPFIGQITMFGGNFAPRGWALCDGQLLPIAQYTALFSLLGTIYGGDGRTTFALPDLRGRVAIHPGNGPGLSQYRQGEKAGVESVTLTAAQMPQHTHALTAPAVAGPGNTTSPVGAVPAESNEDIYSTDGADTNMTAGAIGNTGGNQSHTNIQPYNTVNFIIALQGIYPSRN